MNIEVRSGGAKNISIWKLKPRRGAPGKRYSRKPPKNIDPMSKTK
jgi:hypothetical protein